MKKLKKWWALEWRVWPGEEWMPLNLNLTRAEARADKRDSVKSGSRASNLRVRPYVRAE